MINDTFTARQIRAMRIARTANVVYICVTLLVVALGIVAVVRFSSVFELSRQAQSLAARAAEIRESVVLDLAKAQGEKDPDAGAKAAELLGMQKPQKYQIVRIKLREADFTVVYEGSCSFFDLSE